MPEGKITEGLGALMAEAKRVQQFGFSADEMNRAKAALLAGYERAYKERETSESANYANEYVRHFLQQEPIPGMEFEYKIAATYLPTITADEISALAKELITEDNRVVLGVAPEKKDTPPPSTETMRAAIDRAGTAPVERWAEAAAGRELVEKPPASGKVASRRAVPEIGATVLTLSNGVEVWLKPTDFKNDQVLFSAYAPGGVSLAPEQNFNSASLATAMVGVGGMGGLNPVDLSKMLSGKIAQASPSIAEYQQGISGSSTPKDLETALQLNYLASTAPNMTPDVLELLKRRLGPSLQNRDQNPRAVFGEKVEQVNTSNHYSARAMTAADVPNLNLEAMRSFYNARFGNAADFTYFFVGAFTEAEITPLLEKWIASLPSTGKKTSAARDMGVKFPTALVKEEVKKGKEPASQTVLSFFADPGFDEFEMHRARAAAAVLNIRLREILREELGGTYGVNVGFTNSPPLKGYGAMQIQFGSSPDNIDKLVAASLKEIERLKAEGPSADDVSKVKELERRDLETNAKQNSVLARLDADRASLRLGYGRHRAQERTHRAADAGEHQGDVPEVFSDGPIHARHVEARVTSQTISDLGSSGSRIRSSIDDRLIVRNPLDPKSEISYDREFMPPQFVYVMKGLGKVYPPDSQVLKDIWLSFLPGAKIGVLGLNGAGKSTLLKIMAGVETTTSVKPLSGRASASAILPRSRSSIPRRMCAATSKRASPRSRPSSTSTTPSTRRWARICLPKRWTRRSRSSRVCRIASTPPTPGTSTRASISRWTRSGCLPPMPTSPDCLAASGAAWRCAGCCCCRPICCCWTNRPTTSTRNR